MKLYQCKITILLQILLYIMEDRSEFNPIFITAATNGNRTAKEKKIFPLHYHEIGLETIEFWRICYVLSKDFFSVRNYRLFPHRASSNNPFEKTQIKNICF